MPQPHLYIHLFAGILLIVLSIPLILRRVPMNHVYGVRIPKAFTSEENWYDLNAYGGWLLLVYGVFLTAFGLLARRFAPDARNLWSLLYVAGPFLCIAPVLVLIAARARRLP